MKDYLRINQNKILQYFKNGCKPSDSPLKFGLELEHFIVSKETKENISYYGEQGIEALLKKMVPLYSGVVEAKGHIIGLYRADIAITLEPAAQLEVSISPQSDINVIYQIYDQFYKEMEPLLRQWNYCMVTYGYCPKSKVETLDLIPKKRYEYMDCYFKKLGPYGRQMMRGSASTQLSIDYYSEKDFSEKYKLATVLMPVLGQACRNTPYYEEKNIQDVIPRFYIWNHTDNKRVNIESFFNNGELNFCNYIEFVMQAPIIVELKDGIEFYSEKTIGEICSERELDEKEIEHILSMVFPMIRLKKYLEIRYADSMPIESALCYTVIMKGLFVNPTETLEYLNTLEKEVSLVEIMTFVLQKISAEERDLLLSYKEEIEGGTILKGNRSTM